MNGHGRRREAEAASHSFQPANEYMDSAKARSPNREDEQRIPREKSDLSVHSAIIWCLHECGPVDSIATA